MGMIYLVTLFNCIIAGAIGWYFYLGFLLTSGQKRRRRFGVREYNQFMEEVRTDITAKIHDLPHASPFLKSFSTESHLLSNEESRLKSEVPNG